MTKAFIVGQGQVIDKFIISACQKSNIHVTQLESEKRILEEVESINPDLVFVQASFLDDIQPNLIDNLKQLESFVYTVVYASRMDGSKLAKEKGANAFLPIPFKGPQIESIFRRALSLSKSILTIHNQTPPSSELAALEKKLEEKNYTISDACGYDNGLKEMENVFPDMVIVDQKIDGKPNNTLLEKIKSNPIFLGIPVIMLSEPIAQHVEKLIQLGAAHILLSPIVTQENIEELINIIAPPRQGKKFKALIVDENATVRNLLAKNLKEMDFTIEYAEDGIQAFDYLNSNDDIDLIFTEYEMPGLDGWDLITKIKQDPKKSVLPVVLVTANNTPMDLLKGKILGVHTYIPKPFKSHEIRSAALKIINEILKKKKDQLLEKFVAKDTLTHVTEEAEGISAEPTEQKHFTVLFSDICGFTSLCEKMDSQEVVALLNKYFDAMVTVIQKHNGIIDKFIGDAIAVRFDSGDQKTNALNSVRSAMEMLNELKNMKDKEGTPLRIRIGINTGDAILGNIGSSKYRLEYAMIGDNINIAQRLESNAPQNGCLISESTYKLIVDEIKVEEPQKIKVKGRDQPLTTYVVKDIST